MTVEDIQQQINSIQPDLTTFRVSGGFEIRGLFRLVEAGTLLYEFSLVAFVHDSFPDAAPRIWEIGGRIPRVADRHVNPRDGTLCCFTGEDYALWRLSGGSVRSFFEGPLRNYLLSQAWFMEKGEWPFGERPHGLAGRLDFYREIFGLSTFAGLPECLDKLRRRRFKGHHQCPCGSGKFIRRCHSRIITIERYFTDAMLQEAVNMVQKAIEQLQWDYRIRQLIAQALTSIKRKGEMIYPHNDSSLPINMVTAINHT